MRTPVAKGSAYQGRAFWTAPSPRRRRVKPGWLVLAFAGALTAGWLLRGTLAATPLYQALVTVRQVEVRGNEYLSDGQVRSLAGLDRPADFLSADLARADQRLARAPRVSRARVERALPRRIVITVVERRPVAVVRAGRLLETDERGVILPALISGVVPDVPVISGVRVADARAGQRIRHPGFARALRHLAALARPEIGLAQPVSEVDVSSPTTTIVTLAPDGVNVLLPAEPPAVRPLSALRVVLADLAGRGLTASTIDLRGDEVIAVRPIPPAAPAADSTRNDHPNPRRG